MHHRHAIRDEDWDCIKDLLPGREGLPGVTARDNRLFLDAVLWIAKTGTPWRDLPERFGPWNSVWRRFDRWARKGVWRKVFEVRAVACFRNSKNDGASFQDLRLTNNELRKHATALARYQAEPSSFYTTRRLTRGATMRKDKEVEDCWRCSPVGSSARSLGFDYDGYHSTLDRRRTRRSRPR